MKILACDDNQFLAKIIQMQLLKDKGGDVTIAADGKEAMRLVRDENFDLLVLDLYMPYHSGLELLDYIRQKLKLTTPVIMLSSESLDITVKKAFELGANDFLAKPFDPATLVQRINQLLNSKPYEQTGMDSKF